MTVLEIIRRSAEFLAKKGVESPRLQIELLLAHVLKLPRLQLYLDFERTLTEPELVVLRDLVRRRANREPLQHLVGSTSFCGLEFAVSPAVLIPRPETEVLAERAWTFLSARGAPLATALDFGTGSGCLAVTIAAKCPTTRVTALDISEAALAVARTNAEQHQVSDRLEWVCSDGFAALPAGAVFDLIVSNPPYVPRDEIAGLQPEVRDHDPRLALDGGPDGLCVLRRLAAESGPFLRADGALMVEFGDGQAENVERLFSDHQWQVEAVANDLSGQPRFLIARPVRR